MDALLTHLTRVPQRLLLGLVHGYRLLLKPWLGNACRFEPTCSAYALQALQRHGALRGTALAGWRILRCNPWCAGGCDAVPDNRPGQGLFTGLRQISEEARTALPPAAQPPTRNLP